MTTPHTDQVSTLSALPANLSKNCGDGDRISIRSKCIAIYVALACAWLGCMNYASAQGLVGAPLDPHCGCPRLVYPENNAATIPVISAMTIATFLTFIVVGLNVLQKRLTLINSAIILGIVWTSTGIAYGFEQQSLFLTSHPSLLWLSFWNR